MTFYVVYRRPPRNSIPSEELEPHYHPWRVPSDAVSTRVQTLKPAWPSWAVCRALLAGLERRDDERTRIDSICYRFNAQGRYIAGYREDLAA